MVSASLADSWFRVAPTKEIVSVDKPSHPRIAGCFRIDHLIANHRRCLQSGSVSRGELSDHPGSRFAAYTTVSVFVGANLPSAQDSAECRVKLLQCGFDLRSGNPSAFNTRLVGNHK